MKISEVMGGGSREENEIDQLDQSTDLFVNEKNDSLVKKTNE